MTVAAGENLAVVLTPPGVAAIAVIRLIGPSNEAFAAAHLSRVPKSGRCVHADLRAASGGDVIDDVVVVRTPRGGLDLNLHGGAWVLESTLRLAIAFGYRVVEWTDAAASDADTDIERQMLLDLPKAQSPAVLRLLTAQPAAWRAMLDENDVDAMRRAMADTSLATALAVPSVAIVGPPNVGKSTLANALAGTERSITADVPGTTRDWVGGSADLNGLVVKLIDTPGIRVTDDRIEAAAIERSTGVIAAATCVIVAFDGSRPLDDKERDVLRRYAGDATIVVRTKCDCPVVAAWDGAIDVAAETVDGLPELRAAVLRRLGVTDLGLPHARCWTAEQRYKLERLLEPPPASI